jgi:hypothetical protein
MAWIEASAGVTFRDPRTSDGKAGHDFDGLPTDTGTS